MNIDMKAQYRRGSKEFLANLSIGNEVEIPTYFRYDSMRQIATRMAADFGCRFSFATRHGTHYVRRIE